MSHPQTDTINWPEVYLMAEASSEPFADVRIITAKSEYIRMYSDYLNLGYTLDPLDNCASQLLATMDTHSLDIHESVTIGVDGRITVVVNTDTITDDTTWTALDMLADAMEQLNGKEGIIRFGHPLSFTSSDIPWLTLH